MRKLLLAILLVLVSGCFPPSRPEEEIRHDWKDRGLVYGVYPFLAAPSAEVGPWRERLSAETETALRRIGYRTEAVRYQGGGGFTAEAAQDPDVLREVARSQGVDVLVVGFLVSSVPVDPSTTPGIRPGEAIVFEIRFQDVNQPKPFFRVRQEAVVSTEDDLRKSIDDALEGVKAKAFGTQRPGNDGDPAKSRR